MRLNSLGYQDCPPLPDTRPNAEKAAELLAKSVKSNVSYESERQIAALQGIGFALLALAEKEPETALAAEKPRRSWFRTAIGATP
jgi:hypothetical protein